MNIKKFFKELSLQITETILLILAFLIPFVINVKEQFKNWLDTTTLSPDNFLYYFPIKWGNWAVSIVCTIVAWHFIKEHNKDLTMNTGNSYYNYPYVLYWFCAKVLCIPKCNLILVPIYMQYRLVVRGTFQEYPVDDQRFPEEESAAQKIETTKYNWKPETKEINLVLEDTYPITLEQLPYSKRNLPTLKVSRHHNSDYSRHFSPKFIEEINNSVRSLNQGTDINIYATTNPKNNVYIAQNVFKNANRSNIGKLRVYQQSRFGGRCFEKGFIIY